MEQENIAAANIDPAAMAFDELRSEVLTLRLAIQRLAAAPSEIEIPDYTETLAEIRKIAHSTAKSFMVMRDSPMLNATPDQLAAQIKAASSEARRAEQQSLANAEEALRTVAKDLARLVESARTADRQNKWNLAMLALGLALGVMASWLFGML
jgi:ferric-dicitrate binding protein FerR (iron transport regulator)